MFHSFSMHMGRARRTEDRPNAVSFILQQPWLFFPRKEEHLIPLLVEMVVHHMGTGAEKSVAGSLWSGDRFRQGNILAALYEILAVLPAAERVIHMRTI